MLTSGGVVGHAEGGDAVGSLGVEDISVLGVGDVAVGAAVGEALEDLPRHGPRVGRRRALLRQHHRAPRHHRVQDRHPTPPPSAVWTPSFLEGREEGGERRVCVLCDLAGREGQLGLEGPRGNDGYWVGPWVVPTLFNLLVS